jgi:ATP-dependent protease ClpP protease subunit
MGGNSVRLYGWIGRDVLADDVRAKLRQAGSEPVEIAIRSEGGSGSECLYIANAIADHPGPTIGRVLHHANSGAVLCFAACKRRVASSSARFAFHMPIKTWDSTTTAELEAFAGRYIEFLVRQIGLSWLFVETLMQGGFTLTAREALSYRLVSEIV